LLSLKVKRKVGLISELGKDNKFNGKSSTRRETSAVEKERNLGDKFRIHRYLGREKLAKPLVFRQSSRKWVKNPQKIPPILHVRKL